MVDYLNLTNLTLINLCGETYIKERVEACFKEQALYDTCLQSGKLEILLTAFCIMFGLLIAWEVWQYWKRRKKLKLER